MINTLLSFGAKNVNPEILEQTLTVRKEIVDEIEKNCINKAINLSTCQSLIIAPRGSGKTHIVKVLYHRIKDNEALAGKTVVAYMSEDEVGIANFTDLMVSIIRAFIRYNEPGSEMLEAQIMEASLISSIDKREIFVKNILKDFANKKIIILLIENFDKILSALGITGQGSLRDFIHQYNSLSIIATSQNLIASLQDSKSPFYNFFNVFQLKKLDFEGTVRFLEAIAKTEDDLTLANDIRKPEFEGKLRAIYELTEGNHRLLVTFYSFLKAEFKTDLSGVFIKVMNDLKPYYEQFVNALPPLQQKIVKHLSLNRKAESGKEIARACFIDPNIFSKQISLLFERGMIDKNKSGKDVYYELKEPLMRICFEIGENPNGISKLFVDFLSTYYDRQVIRKQYLKFRFGAKFQCEDLKCKFENEAQMYIMALNDNDKEEISTTYKSLDKINDPVELYNKIDSIETVGISNDYFQKGNDHIQKGQYKKAIESYQQSIGINPINDSSYYNMGIAYDNLKLYENAIESFLKATKINPDDSSIHYAMGYTYFNMKLYEKAIGCYEKAIKLNPNDVLVHYAKGYVFEKIKLYEKAIESYQRAILINPKHINAYNNLGMIFTRLKSYEKALDCYKKAVEIEPKNKYIYNSLGLLFLKFNKIDEALKAFQSGLKNNPSNFYIKFSLLGAYIKINDFNKSKELLTDLIDKADDQLISVSLAEDIFYNLFKDGSAFYIKSYFKFLLNLLVEKGKNKQLWEALPDSLNEILIHIEDYDKERLTNIENTLNELLAEHEESIIPLKLFGVGVSYLKNDEKNALFQLSKEERKLFKEAVLDKKKNQTR